MVKVLQRDLKSYGVFQKRVFSLYSAIHITNIYEFYL